MNIYRILPILAIVIVLFSCSAEHYLQRGDEMYNSGKYYKSCTYYKEAYRRLKSDEDREGVAKMVGDAYEKVNRLKAASSWYNKALKYDESNAALLYKIIEIAHKRGDAEMINRYLNRYESLRGQSPKVLRNYMENFSNSSSRYRISEFDKLNKIGNDFSPVYEIGDTNVIYFSSTRRKTVRKGFLSRLFGGNAKKDDVTGTEYSNIYRIKYTDEYEYKDKKGNLKVRKLKKEKWMKAEALRDSSVNSRFNEGALCFNKKGDKMYFTSSRKIMGYSVGTKIYEASRSESGWGNVKMLNIVPDSVSVGHPAISIDGNRLYFVSDMENGIGGKDIWYSENEEGGWGQPINAGRIVNTEGDEMYPYIRDNGQLYFSSNGHSGLGGLDIFRVEYVEGEQLVKNIGFPFNSVTDDFGIVFKQGVDEGLFSSSRGKKGTDNVYRFKYVPCVYRLTIKPEDTQNGEALKSVNIKMVSRSGKEKNINTGIKNKVHFELDEEDEYLFVLYKDGYLKKKFVINTRGVTESLDEEKVVRLQPMEKSIVLPNIFYDFAKWKLNKESKKALDMLVDVLNENPNIVIELSSHTDMIGSDRSNMILSQRRAQAIVDYLIGKGIYWDRLVAKGYGESMPKEVSLDDEKKYKKFQKGDILNKEYILKLNAKEIRKANQLNRRTEFKVLRTDYKPGLNSKNKNFAKEYSGGIVKEDVLGKMNKNLLIKDLQNIEGTIFTIQLGVFSRKKISKRFNELGEVYVSYLKGKSLFRLTHGLFESYRQAKEYEKQVKDKGFDCFITVYKDGERIDLKEALKLAEKSN